MVVIESEIEDFPLCDGCIYFVNYKCTNEPAEDAEPLDFMDCHQGKDNFMNHKFDRWWIKNTRGSN